MGSRSRIFRLLQVSGLSVWLVSCATVRLPSIQIQKQSPDEPIQWRGMVMRTLESNPDILQAKALVRSGRYFRNFTAGGYLPEVNGTLGRSRLDTAGGSPDNSISLGIEASQNLFSGFGITGRTVAAHKDYLAAKYAYQETSAEVRFRLRSAYIELLKLERLLEVNKRIAERRQQNAEMIRLRYEAGREHIGSSLRADAQVEQALFETRQTERQIENQSLELGRELGGDFYLQMHIFGDLEKMAPQSVEGQPDYVALATETPQVKRVIKSAESAKADIVAAQSEFWPQIDGSFSYSHSADRASELDSDKPEKFLGLSMTMPFFNGGENVNGFLGARADYEAAEEAARSARDETVTQLSSAWTGLLDASEFVKVQEKFLEASRKRSEIVRAQYSSGLSDFQEFDIAEQDLTQSEKSYVQSLADSLRAEANWEFTQGSTLEDVLRAA